MGTPLISMTGNPASTLSSAADANIDVTVSQEACSLDLAPTSSTTATLVMGDALAISLMEAKGFSAEDFAFSHPGGALGRRLLLKVEDVMHSGPLLPVVLVGTKLSEALMEITRKGLGMTTIVDNNNTLVGVFTDGDLRRALDQNIDIHQTAISDIMTRDCKTVNANMLAAEALGIMDHGKISALAVVDETNKPVGAVHLHDLLNAGVA
jgi:arabinose-5-phosphate isomerase